MIRGTANESRTLPKTFACTTDILVSRAFRRTWKPVVQQCPKRRDNAPVVLKTRRPAVDYVVELHGFAPPRRAFAPVSYRCPLPVRFNWHKRT